MATTSEIQVTEAYIGLLGRAPDPAGLAYWVAELDAAIASGTSAAVAPAILRTSIPTTTITTQKTAPSSLKVLAHLRTEGIGRRHRCTK